MKRSICVLMLEVISHHNYSFDDAQEMNDQPPPLSIESAYLHALTDGMTKSHSIVSPVTVSGLAWIAKAALSGKMRQEPGQ